jgi:hypothetical protein
MSQEDLKGCQGIALVAVLGILFWLIIFLLLAA